MMDSSPIRLDDLVKIDPLAYLLSSAPVSAELLKDSVTQALQILLVHLGNERVFSGTEPEGMKTLLEEIAILPETGVGLRATLNDIGKLSVEHALHVNSPSAMAHLHCPVAMPALIAEIFMTATNQSLDSWDQSPFASQLEEQVLTWLLQTIGMKPHASGCFSSGGSQSNMTALYLAVEQRAHIDRQKLVIFTSQNAHFSIQKSARILGLSESSVIAVATDASGCMSVRALHDAIEKSKSRNMEPLAIVATAGTTDLGSIDPISHIANVAERHGLWLHIDAAYGGGLLFSRHYARLAGIDRAHSVTLDFHKMLFQPISCGALLVKNAGLFAPLASKAEYLNPEDDVFANAPNLVERSMQTTRRGDALKVFMTMRTLGKDGIDALICKTLDNAKAAAKAISARKDFVLAQEPSLSTVLFRYVSPNGKAKADEISVKIREDLFLGGQAAIATTKLNGLIHFKLTLLNPRSEPDVIDRILDEISLCASRLEVDN